jgi:serine/threonine protein kinase
LSLISPRLRDLKPENILVTLDGDIKVVDFGVSHDFGTETINSPNISAGLVRDTKGSWPFWSPEMIDNQSANAYSAYSADVWAAGVCLWIFVYGTLPFWAPGPSHLPDPIFDQILSSKFSPPKFPSRRSPELCDLLLNIFTVNPSSRPSFHDLSSYSWLQQHSHDELEIRLNAISSVSIDCSELHLDDAVTPGEVNFLSERAKSHFVKMARRIRERVRERHELLLVAKDEEINTKKEEMKYYDPVPSSPPPGEGSSPPSQRSPRAGRTATATEGSAGGIGASTTITRPPSSAALPDSVLEMSSGVSPTTRGGDGSSPKSGQLGREFSKQTNWTSQTDLEGAGDSRSLTGGSGEAKKSSSSSSCCNIQ